MGFLDSLTNSISVGGKNVVSQLSPTMLLDESGAFSSTDAVTNIIGGGVKGGLMDTLGMDPNCPGGTSKGSAKVSGSNDPCGANNDPLKKSILGLGLAAAGPSIEETGNMFGDTLDEGLSDTTGFLGDSIASAAKATGLDPAGQDILTKAIGVGVGATISGADSDIIAASTLTSAASNINEKNAKEAGSNTDSGPWAKIKDTMSWD